MFLKLGLICESHQKPRFKKGYTLEIGGKCFAKKALTSSKGPKKIYHREPDITEILLKMEADTN